ncbi:uncharacterized protein [Argopecten irradians]|uniref:uncharacterized protein n=1 Tax=Argopecten irradians TaxID=31199 RepID=UPI0037167390
MDSRDSIGELLTNAIAFANVMNYSVDTIYKPIAEEAVAYGNSLNVEVVKCGSHAERLYLPYFSKAEKDSKIAIDASTDIDMMFVFDNYKIVSDTWTADREQPPDTSLYQLVEATRPGYYYIIPSTVVSLAKSGALSTSQIKNDGLSSEILKTQLEKSIAQSKKRQVNLIFMEMPTFNGPSVTFQSRQNSGVMTSIDCVFGVKCSSWPKRVDNFFTRVMDREWPGSAIVRDIKEQGCHLVAIGSHGSPLRPFEWRLSSTKAEKMLALSLSEKQRLAYQITKSLIKSDETTKCISSYYVKTALFWLCEVRPVIIWTESSNMENIRCLMDKMYEFLTKKNVPNYFVEENNLVNHFEEDIFMQATNGLVELRNTLTPRLAQFLEHVSVMPFEVQQTPQELVTSGSLKKLLEYLCVNFCFASMVHTILSQLENKTHVNYLFLAENIFKHLTSSSESDQMELNETQTENTQPHYQKRRLLHEGWSLSRAGLHSACSLLESILQYFQSKDSGHEVVWKLCTELANTASTLLSGYCQTNQVGTPVVDDCMYLLDRSAYLHHEYAFSYTHEYWKRYPKYRIQPNTNPNKLSVYFLEMWIMVLIKYQREGDYQFGKIGHGNNDTMRLPICVRRLVEFMFFYDFDKSWVLLQIDSALFGGKSIANGLKTKRIQHESPMFRREGMINLIKLKLRAKAFTTNKEKCLMHKDLGKMYHMKTQLDDPPEELRRLQKPALEQFTDAITSCPSDVSAKVDFAVFLMQSKHFNASLDHCRDSFQLGEGEATVTTYDANTYGFLPERLREIVGDTLPVTIPSVLLACYCVLTIYKSVRTLRDEALFHHIGKCLMEAISSNNDIAGKLGVYIITHFLSY